MARHERLTITRDPPPTLRERVTGWLSRLVEARSLGWLELEKLFGAGATTAAGVVMTEATALNHSAVWAAVQVIAGDVASLPLFLYKRLPNGGKERQPAKRLYRLLHDQPNPEMTAIVFRETLQQHVLLWGNAYAEIERSLGGEILALWPLTPDRVTPERDPRTQALVYRVRNAPGRERVLRPETVLHVPGLSFDGVTGYSVLAKARESFGLGQAAEKFGAEFFSRGARAGGVFQHPGKLSPPARAHLEASLKALQPHEYAVLEEGMKLEKWSIPPEDAQFLETRIFQVTEVARWFNIPPHKLADLSHATFSNIEHQQIEYVNHCLRKWLVRWEQEIFRKLIPDLEKRQQFVEHLIDGLVRGDITSRYSAYATARQWGWFSANDVREIENQNPLPAGGDVYLIPVNMLPADKADEIQAPGATPPAPAPPARAPEDEDDEDRAAAVRVTLEALTAGQARLEARFEAPVEAAGLADAVAQIRADTEALAARVSAQAPPGRVLEPRAISAHRLALQDALRRLLHREALRARQSSQTPEKLRAWMGNFYAQVQPMIDALLPALTWQGVLAQRDDPAEARAAALIAEHARRSQAELEGLAAATAPEGLAEAVAALTARWEQDRPGQIADALIAELLTPAGGSHGQS